MSDPIIAGYLEWRDAQIATRAPGIPFDFCGANYVVEFTHDGRRILVGPAPKGYQTAA